MSSTRRSRPADRNRPYPSSSREQTCFWCVKPGHRIVDCRQGQPKFQNSQRYTSQAQPKPVTCFPCGGSAHKSNATGNANLTVGRPGKSNIRQSEARENQRFIKAPAKVNGRGVSFLLNTGAETCVVSFFQTSMWKKQYTSKV